MLSNTIGIPQFPVMTQPSHGNGYRLSPSPSPPDGTDDSQLIKGVPNAANNRGPPPLCDHVLDIHDKCHDPVHQSRCSPTSRSPPPHPPSSRTKCHRGGLGLQTPKKPQTLNSRSHAGAHHFDVTIVCIHVHITQNRRCRTCPTHIQNQLRMQSDCFSAGPSGQTVHRLDGFRPPFWLAQACHGDSATAHVDVTIKSSSITLGPPGGRRFVLSRLISTTVITLPGHYCSPRADAVAASPPS